MNTETIWSLRQERVFLPLCESDAHKGTLRLPECWRTWLCACFKLLEESSRKSLPVASPDAVGKSCPLQLAFCVRILYTFLFQLISPLISSCSVHFIFLFFFPFTDSFKQAANTYCLPNTKRTWQQPLVLTEFWGRECKLVIRIQPLLPHSKMAVNRLDKLRLPAFLAVMYGHVPLQHLWQGGGGRRRGRMKDWEVMHAPSRLSFKEWACIFISLSRCCWMHMITWP